MRDLLNKTRRSLAVTLIYALLFAMVPFEAFAAPEETEEDFFQGELVEADAIDDLHFEVVGPEETEEEPDLTFGYDDSGYHPEDYVPDGNSLQGWSSYQETQYEAYNSVLEGDVPAVRNQKPYGTCWAFTAMDTAYITMRHGGYIGKNDEVFSPLALAYFIFRNTSDPLGLTQGDRIVSANQDFLSRGNNVYSATQRLAGRVGATPESHVPYETAAPDMTISNSYAYDDVAVLDNAYYYGAAPVELIKELIVRYGAVYISYSVLVENGKTFKGAVDPTYGYCYYAHDEYVPTNHAVSIVGWDDTIPAECFATSSEAKRPKNSGAWLIRNSWGNAVQCSDGEHNYEGYFWMSYEEATIKNVSVLEMVPADTYDRCYQYDGHALQGYGVNLEYGNLVGNVYRAQKDEKITAVMMNSGTANVTYEIQIYKNTRKMRNPTDGEALLSYPETLTIGPEGIYTTKIQEDVTIKENEWFSVVYRMVSACDAYFEVEVGHLNNGYVIAYGNPQLGESFAGINGRWVDMAYLDATARIKAMTVDAEKISFDPEYLSLYRGEEQSVNILGDSSIRSSANYRAVSEDESKATVSLVGTELTVKGINTGYTEIIVIDTVSQSTANLSVYVEDAINSLTFDKSEVSLTEGDTVQVKLTKEPADSEVGISVRSLNEAVAKVESVSSDVVTIKGISSGTAVILAETEDGPVCAGSVIVNVQKKSSGSSGSSGGGGGGSSVKTQTGLTYSTYWIYDGKDWKVHDRAGTLQKDVWLCDNAVFANGTNVWYVLDKDGNMFTAGLLQDKSGNFYSLETEHNGYYGMLRYKNGTYDGIYLEFSQKHDGTFGAVTNAEGIAALKAKYGVTKVDIGNENSVYTGNF